MKKISILILITLMVLMPACSVPTEPEPTVPEAIAADQAAPETVGPNGKSD